MSLIFLESKEQEMELAQKVFEQQFRLDEELYYEYDERRKRLMLQDIYYNLEYLSVAMKFDAEILIRDYADWLYHLLAHRMRELSSERVKEQMVMHYQVLKEVLSQELTEEEANKAAYHLGQAIQATEEASIEDLPSDWFGEGELGWLREKYLQLLLDGEKRHAVEIVNKVYKEGVSLERIFLEVFQMVMYRIGDLWHKGEITVDKEHYCTAVTQSAIAQFYPVIFATPRKGLSMLACCVGNELHEMGIRMICDLFELRGWDSTYLGAAVPTDSVINAVKENQPDLVAFSVTMPHHLKTCHELVTKLKENHEVKNFKLALGGRAFKLAPDLYLKWEADFFAVNGKELTDWADRLFQDTDVNL